MALIGRLWRAIRYWRHPSLAMRVNRYLDGASGEWWCGRCGGEMRARIDRVTGTATVLESTCPRWPRQTWRVR